MRNELRARYWDYLALHHANNRQDYVNLAKKQIKSAIHNLKSQLDILEELLNEINEV